MSQFLRCLLVTIILPISSSSSHSLPLFTLTSPARQDSIREDSVKSLIFSKKIPVNLTNTPVNTPEQLFAGRIAGVQVTETNGGPGGEFAVTIRGVSKLLGSSEPLYVIDGIPLEMQNDRQAVLRQSIDIPTYALNALSMIDPSEIESIQVLKDISAIALYGTRASNGVVLVTTKKNYSKKLKISLESSASIQRMTRNVEVLNSADFLRYGRQRLADYPDKFSAASYLTDAPESYQNVDWIKELTRTGHIFRNNLTISAGAGPVRISVQGGLFKHEGISKETHFYRKNAGVNLHTDLWKNRIRLGTRLYYADAEGKQRSARAAQTEIPVGPVYNADGSWHEFDFGTFSPLRRVARTNADSEHKRLLSVTHAEITLLKNLSIRSSYGISRSWNDYAPNGRWADGGDTDSKGFEGYYRNIKNYNVDARVHFFHAGKRMRYELDAGYAQFTEFGYFGYAVGHHTAVKALLDSRKSAKSITDFSPVPGIVRSEWSKGSRRMNSVFVQGKIGLGDAFDVLLTSRQDMNPVFPHTKFRQGNASSVRVGWQVNKPGKSFGTILSNLRMHADFGYIAQSDLYTWVSLAPVGLPSLYGKDVPYSLLGSLGLDAGLFSDRLQLGVSYFDRQALHNRMRGMTVAPGSGYVTSSSAIDRMVARGLELSFGYAPVHVGNWSWQLSGNAALMSNRITGKGGAAFPSDIGGSGTPGPVGGWYRYASHGVWQSSQEITRDYGGPASDMPSPGETRYDNNKELAYAGSANPKLIWGLSSAIVWKQLDFSMLIRGEHGQKVQNQMARYLHDPAFDGNVSQAVYENSWTPSHPDRDFVSQEAKYSDRDMYLSDWFLQKASFVRLQSISVGYTYPIAAGRNVRIYLNGQNLLLLTPYKGWDPEVNKYGQDPHYRGVDEGIYPRGRTFTLGVQFNL